MLPRRWSASRLSYGWNDTASPPPPATLPSLFEARVTRTPDAVALVFGEARLTYGELNRRANQLAHVLIRRGVGPEHLVGLCVERTPEMIVGLLAILKAGAAYLPLDLAYPAARLGLMLDDARPGLILASAETAPQLPAEFDFWLSKPTATPSTAIRTPRMRSGQRSGGRPSGLCDLYVRLDWPAQGRGRDYVGVTALAAAQVERLASRLPRECCSSHR